MTEVKKVEKTAEGGGFQNVGAEAGAVTTPAQDAAPKTLAEARAQKAKEDADAAEAQAKVQAEVAERDKNPKPEAKPSRRAEREMAAGSAAVGGGEKAAKTTK